MREGRIGRYTAGRRGKETFPWMSWWSCLSFCRWSSVLCSVMMAIADDTALLILFQEDIKPSAVHCTQSAPWCCGNLLHNNIYTTPWQQKKQPIFKMLDKNQLKKKKGSLTVEHFHGKGMPPSAGGKTARTELSCRNTGSHKVNHHLLSWWLTHGNCKIDRWQPHKHSTSFLSVWIIQGQIVDRSRSKELMKALGQVFHINACRNGAILCVSVSGCHRLHVKRSWFNNVII